jgi:hypothetical protein
MPRSSIPFAVVALGALLGGCSASGGDEAMLVLENVFASANCTTTPAQSEPGISHGTLDTSLLTGYLFIAQVKSRITALDGEQDQRTIVITGANVDITFPSSTVFSAAELADLKSKGLTHFFAPFSAPVTPNGGITDVGFELIPQQLTEAVAQKELSSGTAIRLESIEKFTMLGTMSGESVTSQEFTYSVTIGGGTTVRIVGTCPLPQGSATPSSGYSCNPGQDGAADCCSNGPGELPTCPAVISTTM